MVKVSSNNPYGCMFKAAEMAKTLHGIWMSRIENAPEIKISVGIISDGSLGTIKGEMKMILVYYTWMLKSPSTK